MSGLIKKTACVCLFTSLAIIFSAGISPAAITWTPNFQSAIAENSISTSAEVTVSWTAMAPDTTCSAGSYNWVWDQTQSTEVPVDIPPKTSTHPVSGNTGNTTLLKTLTHGNNWYLHVRAVDTGNGCGNWTSTETYGPIHIDLSPRVTNISPATYGNNLSTPSVTVTGSNFKKADGTAFTTLSATLVSENVSTQVTIPLTIETSSVTATSFEATVAVESKTADIYKAQVTTDNGSSAWKETAFTITNPAPVIDSSLPIAPSSATNDSQTTVTIYGTGFLSTETTPVGITSPTVRMVESTTGGVNFDLLNPSVAADGTSISAAVPSGKTAGTYNVVVTNYDNGTDTAESVFEIQSPAPTIISVAPSSGTNGSTTSFTITGTNYQTSENPTVVLIETTESTQVTCSVTAVTETTVSASVTPLTTTTGVYYVKVTNLDGQSATSSGEVTFTISHPVASVTGITPPSMTNDVAENVTITGTNFRDGATVKIGTTACTGVELDEDADPPNTILNCRVPAEITAGTYDVSVTNPFSTPGTLGGGFIVSAATTSAILSLSTSSSSAVPIGALTITATFNNSQTEAPLISISTQGTDAVADEAMTASTDDKIWTYIYTVNADDGGTGDYVDGEATITVKTSGGTIVSIDSGATFTIDTDSLSAEITYAQSSNTSGPFMAGILTITATFNSPPTNPTIAIGQPGSTDISGATFTSGSDTSWVYDYVINDADGSTYIDGTATVSLSDDSGDVIIGNGKTFTIDTTAPTVALTYLQSSDITTGPFIEGSLTITATFNEAPVGTPQIAINQPGDTDVAVTDMTGTSTIWTYTYTIHSSSEAGYDDGTATVTITNGVDTAGNENDTATNNTFTIVTNYTCFITTMGVSLTSYLKFVIGLFLLMLCNVLLYLSRKSVRAKK